MKNKANGSKFVNDQDMDNFNKIDALTVSEIVGGGEIENDGIELSINGSDLEDFPDEDFLHLVNLVICDMIQISNSFSKKWLTRVLQSNNVNNQRLYRTEM